jgi:protein-S-isoprenylcysteine O-methyltransferase Ste14
MDDYGYGLWGLVVVNALVVIVLAASFFHPKTKRDWRALGTFSAFVVALFTEMYGVPLTVYLLSSWLGSNFLGLDLTHNGGHLWAELTGWKGDPHLSPFHLASYAFLIGGFWLIAAAWKRLFDAFRAERLATDGPYAFVRHPQYVGFMLIVIGFLLQWPTIPTLLMFPVMVLVYRRLSIHEEREVEERFPLEWARYEARVPRFVPRLRRPGPRPPRPVERLPDAP